MKSIQIILSLIITLSLSSSLSTSFNDYTSITESKEDVLKVYYFHSSHRCNTCVTVEKVTQDALNDLYPKQVKAGTIVFESINMDEPTGEYLAKKVKVTGQTLLFVKGTKKTNLTNDAFMYAKSNPDKLKSKIKKTVDTMLAQ